MPMTESELSAILALPHETEWVEFKENFADPEDIGEYISAISNSTALHGKTRGFIIWGVRDGTHDVVGTSFKPRKTKIGNAELENWLAFQLRPGVHFTIHEIDRDGKPVVVFEVPAASHTPVRFKETEFIRVGSNKKKLKDHTEKERALWAIFARTTFEQGVAKHGQTGEQVLTLLDYPAYFDLTKQPLPNGKAGILERFAAENLITPQAADQYDIRNLGAVLFAKNLDEFGPLGRKAVRVISYEGLGRTKALREHREFRGYAAAFQSLLSYIDSQTPHTERVKDGLRSETRAYPEDTIRESLGNSLIHQDFTVTGTGPMVELFADRIEITNPGTPLIDTSRFIDAPPQSRNESLAALMRRVHICEERGQGIDKVIRAVEMSLLPAPDFRVDLGHTKVFLFAPRTFSRMDKADRVRACYQHACLQWVENQQMTNTSLRKRFGIQEENMAMASRVIADTVDAKLIKPHDPASKSRKHAQYVPFWA